MLDGEILAVRVGLVRGGVVWVARVEEKPEDGAALRGAAGRWCIARVVAH